MLELLVIADDFTGALDTGVQLAKRGFATKVRSGAPENLEREETAQVLVADTQSRHLPPAQARERVWAWAKAAKEAGIPLIYKKTDSTLRGNVGAELQGALEGAGRKKLLFVPAYPSLGRTVKKGIAYLNGVPLAETPIAHDPFTPVTSSSVREVLCGQTSLPVRCAGPQAAKEALAAMEEGVLCLDAWEEEQLETIAGQVGSAGRTIVLAGCAGFAGFLPSMLSAPELDPPAPVRAKTMLVVCGSVNAVSLEQADAAEEAGYPSLLLDPAQLLSKDYAQSEAGKDFCRQAADILRSSGCLILRTVRDTGGVEQTRARAEAMGLETKNLHLLVAQNLGALAAGILREQPAGVLTVFGGDTLYALVRELGGGAISPEREAAPGTVQSILQTENGPQVVLSKAGGFGERDALTGLCQAYLGQQL